MHGLCLGIDLRREESSTNREARFECGGDGVRRRGGLSSPSVLPLPPASSPSSLVCTCESCDEVRLSRSSRLNVVRLEKGGDARTRGLFFYLPHFPCARKSVECVSSRRL